MEVGEPITITPDDLESLVRQAPNEYLVLRAEDMAQLGDTAAAESTVSIKLEELKIPLIVSEPMDGAEIAAAEIIIAGQTSPDKTLQLTVNGDQVAFVVSETQGGFRFPPTKLVVGENEVVVSLVGAAAGLDEVVSLRVKLRVPPYLGLNDWYTREALTPDREAEILRCRRCLAYVLRDTWESEHCSCGNHGSHYFTAAQPEFNTGQDRVVRIA